MFSAKGAVLGATAMPKLHQDRVSVLFHEEAKKTWPKRASKSNMGQGQWAVTKSER